MRGWRVLGSAGTGLVLAALSGCQTWVGGTTLPSGHYLMHPPQYIEPSPPYPLTRELATMEAQTAGVPPPGAPVPLPPPLPPPTTTPVPTQPAPGGPPVP